MSVHQPRKFSELSPWQQFWRIGTVIGITGTGVMGALIWAADKKLDEKYATDADLRAVQKQVTDGVDDLKTVSRANTAALDRTTGSVNALTLTVLDLQIREVANDVAALEQDKRARDGAWTPVEQARLREKRQALADLETQRRILFRRLIAGETDSEDDPE